MQTKFLLAHPSFIVLKGLSAVISSLDFLASIRFCSSGKELREMIREENDDIIIASHAMAEGIAVPGNAQLLVLDHGNKTEDMFTISWEDESDAVVNKIKAAVQRSQHRADSEDGDELSQREKDIVRQVALGLTNQEIADTLFISAHTVITHRKNIVRKLGIKTVSGLTVYAILNNLLRMDEMKRRL